MWRKQQYWYSMFTEHLILLAFAIRRCRSKNARDYCMAWWPSFCFHVFNDVPRGFPECAQREAFLLGAIGGSWMTCSQQLWVESIWNPGWSHEKQRLVEARILNTCSILFPHFFCMYSFVLQVVESVSKLSFVISAFLLSDLLGSVCCKLWS